MALGQSSSVLCNGGLFRLGGEEPVATCGWSRSKEATISLGQIFVRALSHVLALKSHFAPGLNKFKPDNDAQAIGMRGANVIILSVGVLLLAFAFSPVKKKLSEEASSIDTQ